MATSTKRTKAWRDANPERWRQLQRNYRRKTRAPCRECGDPMPWPSPGAKYCSDDCRAVQAKLANQRCRLKKKFGMSLDEYNKRLEQQNHVCAICQKPNNRDEALAVDHDHRTGKVRGLLCARCNYNILGHAEDDSNLLRRAADYLDLG